MSEGGLLSPLPTLANISYIGGLYIEPSCPSHTRLTARKAFVFLDNLFKKEC
jgi:hypothetical protein